MTETNNLSTGLKILIDVANTKAQSAEDAIKEAYDYAIDTDKLEPKQAAKVLYANLKYSPEWIRKFLPQEAKQLQIHNPRTKKVKVNLPFSDTKQKEPIIIEKQYYVQDSVQQNDIPITQPVQPTQTKEGLETQRDNLIEENKRLSSQIRESNLRFKELTEEYAKLQKIVDDTQRKTNDIRTELELKDKDKELVMERLGEMNVAIRLNSNLENATPIVTIPVNGHDCGNLYMQLKLKQLYWKYADIVHFDWDIAKNKLTMLLK